METTVHAHASGKVESLHLHPEQPGAPLLPAVEVALVAQKGIEGDHRYFGKTSRQTGQPGLRQVSLIEREQIARHAAALGLAEIPPGAVRGNIETSGIDLISLIGRKIRIGDAVLLVYDRRDPCAKMDAVCQGLRSRMENGHQGVLAQVHQSGRIQCGDAITVLPLTWT